MTDTAMLPFPGVTRRSDSSVYWFVLRAPKDLLQHFKGPWALRQSLNTKDLREANDKARQLHADLAQRFAALRRSDNPQKVELTDGLVRAIAGELRRWVLVADDNARDFPEFTRALLQQQARRQDIDAAPGLPEGDGLAALMIPPTAATQRPMEGMSDAQAGDPLAGLSDGQFTALRTFNAETLTTAAMSQARRDARSVLPLANEVVRSMGLAVDWTGEAGRGALLECLKVYQQAASDAARRDAGEWIDTPAAAPLPSLAEEHPEECGPADKPAHLLTLRDVFELWRVKKPKTPTKKSITVAGGVVDRFEQVCGNPPLAQLTRKHGLQLRDHFLSTGKAPVTARNLLGWVSTLLRHEMAEGQRIESDPWASIKVEGSSEAVIERQAVSPAQMTKLFGHDLFQAYKLPKARNAGRDAAYWLPIMGAYTGARITELAQLLLSDLKFSDSLWVLTIAASEEWQSVKNKDSKRSIPLHHELVRLGLPEYAEAMREAGHTRLFPLVPVSEVNNAGGAFSSWFSKLKTGRGWGAETTFHSFRHTVETLLRRAEAYPLHIDKYVGHKHVGSEGSKTYTKVFPEDLVKVAGLIQHDTVSLPRVFPPEGWSAPAQVAEVLTTKRRE